jgi:hypothetical protein
LLARTVFEIEGNPFLSQLYGTATYASRRSSSSFALQQEGLG